ncbi:hypothetical protein EMIT0210MI2_11066 [Priestia megaterium]
MSHVVVTPFASLLYTLTYVLTVKNIELQVCQKISTPGKESTCKEVADIILVMATKRSSEKEMRFV